MSRLSQIVAMFAISGLAAAAVDFNREVRPILSDKCFHCHGPDAAKREAKLRLDVREDALKVIDLANPGDSELLYRVTATDPDDVMPPRKTHKRVSKKQANTLRQWISEGAPYAAHWAFIPVRSPQPGKAIDDFVQARLKAAGLRSSQRADRRTLIRRVTLDLTGLPPTIPETEAFVADSADDKPAFATVVDRLLRTPQYGEHMSYQWLDAARYADSDGYESDPLRNQWPWRDWVVQALNDNMPFDQFLIEQLAGDLLENASITQRLATGFNRNHRLNNEGGILPEEWVVEYICDRAETTATVFMGLTWGCARCHDHKYDPISQADYYRMFAFFNTMDEKGSARGASDAKPMIQVSPLANLAKFEPLKAKLKPFEDKLAARQQSAKFKAAHKTWLAKKPKLPKALAKVPMAKWKPAQKAAALQHFLRKVDPVGAKLAAESAPLSKQVAALSKGGTKVMVMADNAKRDTHVLLRGAYDRPGKKVSAATPDWLPPMADGSPRNRLGLAEWLVDPQHPLTSRVAVNRIWERFLGAGLVKTQEDFGSQGEQPSHPELLDFLAWQFMDSGWDVKALQKQIVMSDTYCQASATNPELSERDPENRLLARGPRYRLPAPVIRDQALAISGLLSSQIGGPPVKPYQPAGLWKEVIKGSPTYKRDTGDKLYRRSMYTLWRRAVKPPLMTLLDANERDTCRVNQKRTNTPQQALLLLNSTTFVELSRGLATRMLNAGGESDDARIAYAMKLVSARPPSDAEFAILREELAAYREVYTAAPAQAKALIGVGESAADSAIPASELAAFTALARLLFNLDETISKE
jgi:hypothetical protein